MPVPYKIYGLVIIAFAILFPLQSARGNKQLHFGSVNSYLRVYCNGYIA